MEPLSPTTVFTEECTPSRGTLSPNKLLSRFPPPLDHISTLYDSFETTASEHAEVRVIRSKPAFVILQSFSSNYSSHELPPPLNQ